MRMNLLEALACAREERAWAAMHLAAAEAIENDYGVGATPAEHMEQLA